MDGAGARRRRSEDFTRFLIACSVFLLIGVAEALDSRWEYYVTNATILNNSRANQVRYFTQHNWSGKFIDTFPRCIYKGKTGNFIHASSSGGVDDAAIVYSDNLGNGWLLAWSVTNDPYSENRVYVETKLIQDYKNVNWTHVRTLLYASAWQDSYPNATTGNSMTATITQYGAPEPALIDATLKIIGKGYVYSSI